MAYNVSPHAVTQAAPAEPLPSGILEMTGHTNHIIGSVACKGANLTRTRGAATVAFRPVRPLNTIIDVMHVYVQVWRDEYLRLPGWLMPAFEAMLAKDPNATDFKMIRTANPNKYSVHGSMRGWDNYTIEILSAQSAGSKPVAKRVIDPNKDCSCGGERTGYAKGNPGHAHWCAWRQA